MRTNIPPAAQAQLDKYNTGQVLPMVMILTQHCNRITTAPGWKVITTAVRSSPVDTVEHRGHEDTRTAGGAGLLQPRHLAGVVNLVRRQQKLGHMLHITLLQCAGSPPTRASQPGSWDTRLRDLEIHGGHCRVRSQTPMSQGNAAGKCNATCTPREDHKTSMLLSGHNKPAKAQQQQCRWRKDHQGPMSLNMVLLLRQFLST